MRIRYKPFSPDQLRVLGLPEDPADAKGLAAIPTPELQVLVDRAYEQLDCEYPSPDAAEWYEALAGLLDRRELDETAALRHPA
ncbi:hypothetical protein KKR91_16050 [Arthrobacter jiangjiafuii]|uniref:Uncharacterized protein n=1 Tax=Arthrobacter jiangjiafuii TaxID=2817475 RepID=A0A975M4Y3_9MICC|nr:hypothetical protein [Arthrobacter jiangjiafuii]MBP3042299.1 hypothetical protein [Arthrobacter jiangjiafuii]QWC09945.1 hypothetical protein KKR91_16050 [Arthrobacter jiangjiafuii]